jgi:phosphate transport system ATP-binding protein
MSSKFDIQDLSIYFQNNKVLKNVSMEIPVNKILGIIGPSGSGKTTFLRALNRMNDLEPGSKSEGKILMDGNDITIQETDVVALRKKVGMVFAMPVPLPMSVFENVVYGVRLSGINDKARLDELVEKSLGAAYLWNEVKDRLNTSGMRLSGGQQQRLCLARVLAMEPEVILLDEPCSGLDPISTLKTH